MRIWPLNTRIREAYRSPKWKSIRNEHLKIYPNCMACGSKKNPEVHHIIPVHIDSDKELDSNNLITLCDKYCHFIFGHLMNWKSWNPDIVSDSLAYNTKLKNNK
jgi:5-methylcytosine-specific restriction endonuclease McrA